jgi:hypothetical protein
MTEPIKRRPRWLRFSLRTLLVVMTLLCVWVGIRANAGRRQREAVEAIKSAGGTVVYDYQYVPRAKPTGLPLFDYRVDFDAQPPISFWLRMALGDDCFRTVVAVYFNDPKPNIAKAEFDQIAALPALRQFVLGPDQPGWKIEGSDLAALAEPNQLEVLQLFGTHVTGDMLAQLHSLTKLTAVTISNSDFDDAAMEQIGKMTNLRSLDLDGTEVTDAGIRQLRNLTKLKQLYLHRTAITDGGLKQLADLKQLVELWVQHTHVTKIGVGELQKCLPNATIYGP